MKYILTKDETIRRTERIQYEIEIPKNTRNKIEYAHKQVEENNYKSYRISDIIDSERLNDEVIDFKIKSKY